MPLLFANQGPPSAILLEKAQSLNHNRTYCGGSAVSMEEGVCVDSLESMLEFVVQHMGVNVKPISAPSRKMATLHNYRSDKSYKPYSYRMSQNKIS